MRLTTLSIGVLGLPLSTGCHNPSAFTDLPPVNATPSDRGRRVKGTTAFLASGELSLALKLDGPCALIGTNVEIRMGNNVLRAERASFRIVDGAMDEVLLDGSVRLRAEMSMP